eukprot:NODE_726_length_4776_cov_0.427106.p1 type:complete len:510 gc:universal NODE_726_length_4776_cov_0.427106:613-2142(+)
MYISRKSYLVWGSHSVLCIKGISFWDFKFHIFIMITDEKFLLLISRLSILNTEDNLAEKISDISDPRTPEDSLRNYTGKPSCLLNLTDDEFNVLLFDTLFSKKPPFVYSSSPPIDDLNLEELPKIPNDQIQNNSDSYEIKGSKTPSDERLSVGFPESFTKLKPAQRSSALANLLLTSVGTENPLSKFSFVSGSSKETSVFLNIFIPFSNSNLSIQVLKTALVSDVIGYVLMKYIEKGIKPLLPDNKQTTNAFELKIADDDGEIDEDFPAVDKNRQISVFQFKNFGLVVLDKEMQSKDGQNIIFLRVHLYSTIDIRHTTTFKCDGTTLLSTIHETVCKKRQVSPDLYFLFLNDMKTPLDINKNVATLNGITELVMLRKSAGVSAGDVFLTKKSEINDLNLDELKKMPRKLSNAADTSIYKRYNVKIKSLFGKEEKIFCIDGEYVLIMPTIAETTELSSIISIHLSKVSQIATQKSDKTVLLNFIKSEGPLGKSLEFEVGNSAIKRKLLLI